MADMDENRKTIASVEIFIANTVSNETYEAKNPSITMYKMFKLLISTK